MNLSFFIDFFFSGSFRILQMIYLSSIGYFEMLYSSPSFPAEMYNDAAEGRHSSHEGRLSTKYYMLSEECYGEVEE